MAAAAGLLLALTCIAIVAIGCGLAAAASGCTASWAARIARGTAITVGALLLALAALHPIVQALP